MRRRRLPDWIYSASIDVGEAMDLRNSINLLRQALLPKPRPGFAKNSLDKAWQLLFDFLELHRERIAEHDATDSGEDGAYPQG